MSKKREHEHYVRSTIIGKDKKQTKFTSEGTITKIDKHNDFKAKVEDEVYCPFCLHKDKLHKFLISDKKGISTYKVKCPNCGNSMLMRTLQAMFNMNFQKIEAYAKWCYMYSFRFWNKITKVIWDKRMKELGWDITFWSTYRKLKGNKPKEKYNEMI